MAGDRPFDDGRVQTANVTVGASTAAVAANIPDNSNFELVFVSRIPQIRLKKSVTEIL